MQRKDTAKVAVVGLGPRGLGALEALETAVPATLTPLKIDIFEPLETPGAGPNFDPRESQVCRLNIPMRDIDIRPPEAGHIGHFADWLGGSPDPDMFPARAKLGRYLEARYADLRERRVLALTCTDKRIETVDQGADGWTLTSTGETFGPYSEVLLTLGQPAVVPDPQLESWQDHATTSDGTLANAYPAHALTDQARDWTGKTVAIRGLALSAFDVIRVLTIAQGGQFEADCYNASGKEPARILPFSLDGQPPYPKPDTEEIDGRFAPTAQETSTFVELMTRASATSPEKACGLIDAALIPVARRVLSEVGRADDAAAVADWLDREWTDPGSQETGGPVERLRHGIAMAEGRKPPSIGYAIGQVWRKWQNEVRQGYNPTETPPETAEKLICFDEGLKRFSYGPPVSSSRELAALIDAGIVHLGFSADPNIALVDGGWKLNADGREVVANVMVDAVLPSPDLSIVTAPLVKSLIKEGRLRQLINGLGGTVAPDGTVEGIGDRPSPGLAFLGRLALGSVIAVDSLHDCFGEGSQRWADGVAERLVHAEKNADR